MKAFLPGLVILGLMLAGCAAQNSPPTYYPQAPAPLPPPPPPPPGAVQAPTPVRHDWASNSPIAVSAGEVYDHKFEVTGKPIPVGYQLVFKDDSSVNSAFILADDVAEYRQGQQVQGWAVQSNTQGTTQEATMAPGSYALVIRCRNSFADCDLNYSLWATY